MQISTKVRPGFDCRHAPCQHPVKGDHGICADRIFHVVRHELSDGRRVALELEIMTNQYPPTVPALARRDAPECNRLQLHVQLPAGGVGQACEHLLADSELQCHVPWDTYASEVDRLQDLIGVPKNARHSDVYYEMALAPRESFWIAMRNQLRVLLADPALFVQDDETPTMADVRTRYDQAHAALRDAEKRVRATTTELESAILAYRAGDSGYKRR